MITKIKHTFHSDPAHGWLEVDRSELSATVLAKISSCSYQDGNKVFLDNMAKLGIVKEAPKKLEINELQHRIDWAKVLDGKTQEEATELFDSLRRGRS